MRHYLTVRVLLVGILLGLLGIPVANAADPYFAPYGAHRGRIHIGPRHARIRWGGGVTPYGAAVLMHGFDVAGSVGRAYFGGGGGGGEDGGGDDSGSMSSESAAEHESKCQEQLRRTQDLLEETKKACCLKGQESAPVAPEPGVEPAPSSAPSADPHARIEAAKRQVAQTLPVIEELQQTVARQKKAAEDFEQVLARDRQVFEAFVQAYQNP